MGGVYHDPGLLPRVSLQAFCNKVGNFHHCEQPSSCRDTVARTFLPFGEESQKGDGEWESLDLVFLPLFLGPQGWGSSSYPGP